MLLGSLDNFIKQLRLCLRELQTMPNYEGSKIVKGPTVVEEFGKLNYGYYPDREEIKRFQNSLSYPSFGDTPTYKYRNDYLEVTETTHWRNLRDVEPSWRRGNQGIGDCVSWGWELSLYSGASNLVKAGKISKTAMMPIATEALYGGGRVEARGGRLGGYSDGSYGSAQAKFCVDWGFVLRKDYSQQTGIAEHDLRKYDARKAKAWGNYGCGGKDDAGRGEGLLDNIAKEFDVQVTPIRNADQAWTALVQGFSIAVCSGVGYGQERRNSEGVVGARGRWAHCMAHLDVRKSGGSRLFRNVNSWGRSASGPDPGIDWSAWGDCGYWVTEQDANRQYNADDTYAVSMINGFEEPVFSLADLLAADFD